MTVLLEPEIASSSQKKRASFYRAPKPLSRLFPESLQKAKRRCSPQTKRETAFSFKKSLLSLLLIVGLFHHENPLLSGNSSTSGLGVRTSELVDSAGVNHVSREDVFSRVTESQDVNGDASISYDEAGEVTSRSFSSGSLQNLTWDSFGRFVSVDRGNGNVWNTIYDGLGRRIETSCNGNKINYYYDPQVEFLELGHALNGTRSWNLYGPDRSGIYGGAQGIGGLEIEGTEGNGYGSGVLKNYFGDVLALINSGVVATYDSTYLSYGLAPGSAPTQAASSLAPQWRGHYLDWTGLYYMGARYYDPVEGRFLSADPLGTAASMSLYDYCNGDPVNGLDPDGRCVEGAAKGYTIGAFAKYDNLAQTIGGFAGTLGSYATPGVGEYALARDIAGSAWNGAQVLGDIWDNGLNWNNGTQLGLSSFGMVAGSYATMGEIQVTSSTVVRASEESVTWPANSGFLKGSDNGILQTGSIVDRFGGNNGMFVSPQGVPFEARSLPAAFISKPLSTFEVIKPINIEAGISAPWFSQPGKGIQLKLPQTVQELIDSGHLRLIGN